MKYLYNEAPKGFLERNLKSLKKAKELANDAYLKIKEINKYLMGVDIITPATSVEPRLTKLMKDIDREIDSLEDMLDDYK